MSTGQRRDSSTAVIDQGYPNSWTIRLFGAAPPPAVRKGSALPWSFYISDEGALIRSEHRSCWHPEPAFWANDSGSSFFPARRHKAPRSFPPAAKRRGSG